MYDADYWLGLGLKNKADNANLVIIEVNIMMSDDYWKHYGKDSLLIMPTWCKYIAHTYRL